MDREPIWTRVDTGAVVQGKDLTPTSAAQDRGESPFADYICVDTQGAVCDPWTTDGRDRTDIAFVEAQPRLPETADEGDTCALMVYGGSGCYTCSYVFAAGGWKETETTVPWQLSA